MWMILTAILSHPIALGIAGSFAGLQFYTAIRLKRCLRRQIAIAESLRCRGAIADAVLYERSWFHWASRSFPPDRAPVLSREDALKECDRRLADELDYARLQRLAVGAPLIGVLITAFGFLNPPAITQTETLSEIFTAVTPLILGVAYGAVLALLNQFLLYRSERSIDDLRSQARAWFDEMVWLPHGNEADEDRLGDSMRNLADELSHQFRAVESAANILAKTGSALERCLADFSSKVEPLPSSLTLFKSASDATTAAFKQLVPAGTQLGALFERAVLQFKETIDAGFSNVVKQQEEASSRLVHAATRTHDVILKMEQAASAIEINSRLQQEAAHQFHQSIDNCIIPHQQLVLEALQRIDSLTSGLLSTMEALDRSLTQFVGQSAGLFAAADSSFQQFATAAGNLQGAVETQFEPAAQLHRAVLAGIASTADRTEKSVEKLLDACGSLGTAALDQAAASRELTKCVDSNLTPAHALLTRAATHFDNIAEELAEHVDRLRSSLGGAATSLNALLPLAKQAFNEMPNAVSDFRDVVTGQFKPAAQLHAEVVERIGGGVDGFNNLVAGLLGATAELTRIVDGQASAANAFQPACDAVRAAAVDLTQLVDSLRGAVAGDVLPAQKEVHAAANSLHRSAEMLAGFIEKGVSPATQRLKQLDQTIASLNALLNDIRPLGALGREASHFLDGISKAAEVALALNALPREVTRCMSPPIDALTLAVSELEKRLRQPVGENGKSPWWNPFRSSR